MCIIPIPALQHLNQAIHDAAQHLQIAAEAFGARGSENEQVSRPSVKRNELDEGVAAARRERADEGAEDTRALRRVDGHARVDQEQRQAQLLPLQEYR